MSNKTEMHAISLLNPQINRLTRGYEEAERAARIESYYNRRGMSYPPSEYQPSQMEGRSAWTRSDLCGHCLIDCPQSTKAIDSITKRWSMGYEVDPLHIDLANTHSDIEASLLVSEALEYIYRNDTQPIVLFTGYKTAGVGHFIPVLVTPDKISVADYADWLPHLSSLYPVQWRAWSSLLHYLTSNGQRVVTEVACHDTVDDMRKPMCALFSALSVILMTQNRGNEIRDLSATDLTNVALDLQCIEKTAK